MNKSGNFRLKAEESGTEIEIEIETEMKGKETKEMEIKITIKIKIKIMKVFMSKLFEGNMIHNLCQKVVRSTIMTISIKTVYHFVLR
jgi:hypothetical protein